MTKYRTIQLSFVPGADRSDIERALWDAMRENNRWPQNEIQGLTDAHYATLMSSCKIDSFAAFSALERAVSDILEGYKLKAPIARSNGPLSRHKKRIGKIATLAKRLQPLLEEEPLLYQLAADTEHGLLHRYEMGEAAGQIITARLRRIADTAAALASSDARLAEARLENVSTGKSCERHYIWEPFLRLWDRLGYKPGYTEGGPIIRALGALHEALDLDPPNPHAVRQAIDDFVGRVRSSRV